MKRPLVFYIFLGSIALTAGCKITDEIIDAAGPLPHLPNWGYLTADINGADWSRTYKNAYQVTHGIVSYTDEPQGVFFGLISILHSESGLDRQHLLFQKIPFATMGNRFRVTSCLPGTDSQMNSDAQATLHTCEGDVSLNNYYTVNSEDNYIQIDSYNKKTQEIEGTFQLTFAVQDHRSPNDPLPDTVRFRNGRFHTKIIRYKSRGE